MAEHPGAMEPGEFDLVGFAVGVAERDGLITGEHVAPGDVLIGLPSPGLRSNGYSLARRVLLELGGRSYDAPAFDGSSTTLADELLRPSVIYAPAIMRLLREVDVRAVSHITGGGIVGNLARVLPGHVDAVVHRRAWEVPRIFTEIQQLGEVSDDEMAKVFNLGIGMIVAVPAGDRFKAIDTLRAEGHLAMDLGEVVAGHGRVHIEER
jgi:phosphoribosylformylglycinamidine cyclo-ligase